MNHGDAYRRDVTTLLAREQGVENPARFVMLAAASEGVRQSGATVIAGFRHLDRLAQHALGLRELSFDGQRVSQEAIRLLAVRIHHDRAIEMVPRLLKAAR